MTKPLFSFRINDLQLTKSARYRFQRAYLQPRYSDGELQLNPYYSPDVN